MATAGGAHGWTKSVERQEKFKDFRAVAFEAAQSFRLTPLSLFTESIWLPSDFHRHSDIFQNFNSFNTFQYESRSDSFYLPLHRYMAPAERADFAILYQCFIRAKYMLSLCVAYLPHLVSEFPIPKLSEHRFFEYLFASQTCPRLGKSRHLILFPHDFNLKLLQLQETTSNGADFPRVIVFNLGLCPCTALIVIWPGSVQFIAYVQPMSTLQSPPRSQMNPNYAKLSTPFRAVMICFLGQETQC